MAYETNFDNKLKFVKGMTDFFIFLPNIKDTLHRRIPGIIFLFFYFILSIFIFAGNKGNFDDSLEIIIFEKIVPY